MKTVFLFLLLSASALCQVSNPPNCGTLSGNAPSGTPSSSTFCAGDGSWKAASGGAASTLANGNGTHSGNAVIEIGFPGTDGTSINFLDMVNQNTAMISRMTMTSNVFNPGAVNNDALSLGTNLAKGGSGCESASWACIWTQWNSSFVFSGSNTVEYQINHENAGTYNGLSVSLFNLNVNGTTGVDNFANWSLQSGMGWDFLSGDGTNVTSVTATWSSSSGGTFTFTKPTGNWAWDYQTGTGVNVTNCTPAAYNSANAGGWTLAAGGAGLTTWTVTGVGANPGSSATGCTVQGGINQQYAGINPTGTTGQTGQPQGILTNGNIGIQAGGLLTANNSGNANAGLWLNPNSSGTSIPVLLIADNPPANCISHTYQIIYTGSSSSQPDAWYGCPISSTAAPTVFGEFAVQRIGNSGGFYANTGSGLGGDFLERGGTQPGFGLAVNYTNDTNLSTCSLSTNGSVFATAAYLLCFNTGSPNTSSLSSIDLGGQSGVATHLRGGGTVGLGVNSSGVATYGSGSTAGVTAGSFSAITAIQTVVGGVTVLTGTSDARLKTQIKPYGRGIEAIMDLHPALYHWNEAGQKITGFPADLEQAGFIAQDVQKAIPEAVGLEPHDGVDYLNLNDRPIVAALVKAVQEQQAQIEQLKAEVEALKRNQ